MTTAKAPTLESFRIRCLSSRGRRDMMASVQSMKPSRCMNPQLAKRKYSSAMAVMAGGMGRCPKIPLSRIQ